MAVSHREREAEYFSLLREHFPTLVGEIAGKKPDAIIALRNRGVGHGFLLRELWEPLGFGKVPPLHFLSPPARKIKPTKPKLYDQNLKAWVNENGLEGKRVVLLDDLLNDGETLIEMERALARAGVNDVHFAAFSKVGANQCMYAVKNVLAAPWYIKFERIPNEIHAATELPEIEGKRGLAVDLRRLAREIIERNAVERRIE